MWGYCSKGGRRNEEAKAIIFIGIDPGISGGIAWIETFNAVPEIHPTTVQAFKMPSTESDIASLLCSIFDGLSNWSSQGFAYLEKAHAYPGGTKLISCPKCRTVMKTRVSQGIASTWKFSQNYGTIRGILTALHIPFETISPMAWQTGMKCRTGGDKNISKRRAQQLFPDLKITHAKADALLISEFCRRMRSQGVSLPESTIPYDQEASHKPIGG